MSWWGGIDTSSVRGRMQNFQAYEKIFDMQNTLLQAGAKKAELWHRVQPIPNASYYKCPCVLDTDSDQPKNPHSICYGTGAVGGFLKSNYFNYVIYKDSPTTCKFYDFVHTPVTLTISGNSVVTDYITDINLTQMLIQSQILGSRSNAIIEYSADGSDWVDSFYSPSPFKVRISGIDTAFEIVRFRFKSTATDIKFSELPPMRLEELLKYGFDPQANDIKYWTIGVREIQSGDFVRWLEGEWANALDRTFIVTNRKITKLFMDDINLGSLSQVLSLREIRQGEQLGRVW